MASSDSLPSASPHPSPSVTPHDPLARLSRKSPIAGLDVNGNYWIVHRLRFSGSIGDTLVKNNVGKGNNIYNRILVENSDAPFTTGENNSNVVLQNSVLRNTPLSGTGDKYCVSIGWGSGHKIVNNEVYNCQGDEILVYGSDLDSPDLVIENNDLYVTSAMYSDGSGGMTPSGNYACSENGIDMKQGGTVNAPVRVIKNRLWGFRTTDANCADGSFGEAIIFHVSQVSPNDYGLIQNNIIMDGTQAIASPNGSPRYWSLIGNLVYNMSGVGSGTWAYEPKNSQSVEAYLNTFIDVAKGNSKGWIYMGADANNDVRCNAVVDGGFMGGAVSGTSQIDYNAYYATSDAGETHKITKNVYTHATFADYSEGAIMRTAAVGNCVNATDAACFLYKAIVAGKSAGSSPTPCTTLGCTHADGGVTWQAIRGPLSGRRKLRTTTP